MILYLDLEEMQLKSLYEAELVSNRLFNNETAFRDQLIQVRLGMSSNTVQGWTVHREPDQWIVTSLKGITDSRTRTPF